MLKTRPQHLCRLSSLSIAQASRVRRFPSTPATAAESSVSILRISGIDRFLRSLLRDELIKLSESPCVETEDEPSAVGLILTVCNEESPVRKRPIEIRVLRTVGYRWKNQTVQFLSSLYRQINHAESINSFFYMPRAHRCAGKGRPVSRWVIPFQDGLHLN